MNQVNTFKFFCMILFLVITSTIYAQGRPYEGPEDPAGDISNLREGYLNGNRVLLYFQNFGRAADWWSKAPSDNKWPNTYDGLRMIDHAYLAIMSEIFVLQDSIPIESLDELQSYIGTDEVDTLYYIQSYGSGATDRNYENTIGWGFWPVKGYFNETQDYIAMSNKEESWPPGGWPARGFDKKWSGEWNGRFGRGIQYADQETYYVFNDAQDLEYIVQRNDPEEKLITDESRYYPRPGKFIGDVDPNVTVQKGYPWGGLGLRVSTRGFQWNNPEAQDMVFWEYDISNVSDYTLPVCGFAYITDLSVGDEHGGDDDNGYFNTQLDMAYAWDWDGIGVGGLIPGTFGIAYLESPGLAYDNIDNDEDGLIDEKRDNPPGEIIGAYDGISNLSNFLNFYHLKESQLRDHFEGDEDQDWRDGNDANGNGTYAYQDDLGDWYVEPGEETGDDVGLDGVGPADLNYFGPDEGECNHIPDFLEGEGCEPNFAATDVSESDMLGLTTFRLSDYMQRGNYNWSPRHDENFYKYLNSHEFDEYTGASAKPIDFLSSSSPFPLYAGRTERISVGMLHAYENLADLQSSTHSAPNLFRLKGTAQLIYERDYRFAQPPLLPTLKATPGDGKVILTWDDRADKLTREPFLNNVNDFEGYKIYRSTDKLMADTEVITDGKGAKMFKKPIFQCDLIDTLHGYVDYGAVGGNLYYLGDETGITHFFVDENVQNGRTYYYALVAYDYGAPEVGSGISPTENNIVIELDESEKIVRLGKNVAVVTPHQKAAGYVDPSTLLDELNSTWGSGYVLPEIIDRNAIKTNHTYKVKFKVDTVEFKKPERQRHFADGLFYNRGIYVYDVTKNNSLVYEETPAHFPLDNIVRTVVPKVGVKTGINTQRELWTDPFDGIQLKFKVPVVTAQLDTLNTDWLVGDSPVNVSVSPDAALFYPWQYEIIFTNQENVYQTKITKTTAIYHSDGRTSVPKSQVLLDIPYSFSAVTKCFTDSSGDYIKLDLVGYDVNENGVFDLSEDYLLAAFPYEKSETKIYWSGTIFSIDFHNVADESQMPQADDIYRIDFIRPFTGADSILFSINAAEVVVADQLNSDMENIKVVPNPYIVTNAMEPSVSNKFLNQRRRLMFTNIPADCEINIFTSSGVLVDKLDINNEPSNGIVHWDLLTRENLEVAAGMYIYHVKSKQTGKEKIGKFAVIK